MKVQEKQNRIVERYKKFFVTGDKVTSESGKKISYIDYDLLEEFFETLARDEDVPEEIKVGACLFATGGNRFQEAARIKKSDLSIYKGMLIFETDVLKKKHIIKYETLMVERLKRLHYDKTKDEFIERNKEAISLWMKFLKRTPNSTVKEEFSSRYEETLELFTEAYEGLVKVIEEKPDISPTKATGELRSLSGVKLRADQLKSVIQYIKESKSPMTRLDLRLYIDSIRRYYKKNYDKLRKKDTPRRECVVIPCMEDIIKDRVQGLRHAEFLLKRNNLYYYRWFKKHFGELFTIHSFRHSFVSYLLFNKKMTDIEVANMLEMSIDNVKNYAKYKRKDELTKLYS